MRIDEVAGPLEYKAELPPRFGNTQYKEKGGVVIETDPKNFLDASLRLQPEVGSQNRIDALKMKIKQGVPLDPPALFMKNGKIVRHDGRHRATAAFQLGIPKMPVILFSLEGELTRDVIQQKGDKIIHL